jgi:hypothetical protein
MAIAKKGKVFTLTAKGKAESISWRSYDVGSVIDTWAPNWAIDLGYLEETDDPDWIVCPGFKAVYNYKGRVIGCGNGNSYPFRWMAEREAKQYNAYPWFDHKAYVIEATYEGKRPREMRTYNGKPVYNMDTWLYDGAEIGDLVEEEVIDEVINCLPPACDRRDCVQLGEPAGSKVEGTTYETFKKVDENTWAYCGQCFRGENIPRGTDIAYC